jgi:hypothetical protein
MRAAIPISAAIAALAIASPAGAAAPDRERSSFDTAPRVIGQCDDADLVSQFHITITETVYYDGDGEPARVRVHMSVPGTITNTGTGQTLETLGVRNITETADSFVVRGSGVHVVIPGLGTVELEAGLEAEDGHHGYRLTGHRITGATDEICAALSA